MTGSAKSASTLREEAVDWFLQRRESPDDLMLAAHFDAWIAGDERHAKAYERVRCLMGDAGALLAGDQAFLARATRRRGGGKAKAAAAAIAGVSRFPPFTSPTCPCVCVPTICPARLERQVITAPDGSTIT